MSILWWIAVLTLGPTGFVATPLLIWALCRTAARADEQEAEMIACRRTQACASRADSMPRRGSLAEEFSRHLRARRGAGCAR